MSPAVLYFLSEHQSDRVPYGDFYAPAKLTIHFDGQDHIFEDVGVRQKGNTSRHHFYDDQFGVYSEIHFKVSLKATFDDPRYLSDPVLSAIRPSCADDSSALAIMKKRNFMGYEKFDLKFIPRNDNSSIAREIYSYRAFENAGIYAPKTRVCQLRFGGNNSFMEQQYQLIETIDKKFFTRRLGKGNNGGDLYKCVYNSMGQADFSRYEAIYRDGENAGQRVPNGKIGVEDDYIGYLPSYQLKTNDDLGEGSDFSKMANLIQTFWSVRFNNGTKQDLENVLDVDQFLKFSAISYLLGNGDDQRYNNNNFYLYFMPSNGKAIFVPYDWDWSLGLGGVSEFLYHSGPLDQAMLGGNGQPNNLYMITFLGNENLSYSASDYRQSYLNYVNQYKNSVLNSAAYENLLDQLGCSKNELWQVNDYMNAKASVC